MGFGGDEMELLREKLTVKNYDDIETTCFLIFLKDSSSHKWKRKVIHTHQRTNFRLLGRGTAPYSVATVYNPVWLRVW